MDFRALRDNVEHIAAQEIDETEGKVFLTLGMTFIGIYEELAGIRKALEDAPLKQANAALMREANRRG